jgi:hypothetical protein
MERGPLALFGAIVAVGVGPALWLGAQLGAVNLTPGQRPAPVEEQFPGADLDFGGAGAGDLADDGPVVTYSYSPPASPVPKLVATSRTSPAPVVSPKPPASSAPPTSPSASASSPPVEEEEPSADPSTSDSASPSASADPEKTEEGEP